MSQNKVKRFHLFLLLIVLAVFIWSVIKPEEGFSVWLLEVSPTIVILIIVLATYKKFRFTTLSYIIISVLAILTFIGGHYSYSKVPLFNWIKDYFDLKRNHYDRFGHIIKGLMVIPIKELLIRKTPLTKGKTTSFIAICIALSTGALYEIVEWLSTIVRKKDKTQKEFLGMQGDMWDSQWDMFLLLVGSILAILFLSKLHDKYLAKDK